MTSCLGTDNRHVCERAVRGKPPSGIQHPNRRGVWELISSTQGSGPWGHIKAHDSGTAIMEVYAMNSKQVPRHKQLCLIFFVTELVDHLAALIIIHIGYDDFDFQSKFS